MAGTDMSAVPAAIRRRGLRHPRRITDRAESNRCCMDVIADGLQPFENRLPLFPIQLPQERPQPLDERILEQRFAIGFRNKEPVQANIEGLGYFLQSAEARRHLAALDAGQVGARNFRARLQLALGHRARFAQLANALADILDRLLVGELLGRRFSGCFLRRGRWRNQEFQTLRQGAHTTAAVSRARPVLDQTTCLTANDFPIHLERMHRFFLCYLCRHRYSSLTLPGVRMWEGTSERSSGKTETGASGVLCEETFSVKGIFELFLHMQFLRPRLYDKLSPVPKTSLRHFFTRPATPSALTYNHQPTGAAIAPRSKDPQPGPSASEPTRSPSSKAQPPFHAEGPRKGRRQSRVVNCYWGARVLFRRCFRFSLPAACVALKHGYGYGNPRHPKACPRQRPGGHHRDHVPRPFCLGRRVDPQRFTSRSP